MRTLATLPSELLAQIVTHIETARTLSNLLQTCRRLRDFAHDEGFRVFVQTRFPYVELPNDHLRSFWRDAAHGLTTLERNWDRKAFIACNANPKKANDPDRRRNRTYFRSGQTMGFVPMIDSYETWYGGNWTSRKEVVAWSAGADLILRVKIMGSEACSMWAAAKNRVPEDFNVHHHRIKWAKYHQVGVIEGRDDITSLNLLPQPNLEDPEQVILGRASGHLCLLSLSAETPHGQPKVLSSFETAGRAVRSATVIRGRSHLLAACLSDSSVVLYPLDTTSRRVSPVEDISLKDSARTWSSCFLNHSRLAIGHGPSSKPIRVYDCGRGELTEVGARQWVSDSLDTGLGLDTLDTNAFNATSVYSLTPLPASSSNAETMGAVFLSGAYDGLCRLHDLRTPNSTVALFRDPVDTFSPIYSLLPIGTDRFVAGGGRHSIIKVFDIRVPEDKLYAAADISSGSPSWRSPPNLSEQRSWKARGTTIGGGWNVFLNAKSKGNPHGSTDSPVYSLSRPSQCSPSFFAGIENSVVQMDMVSIMDRYPDLIYKDGPPIGDDWGDISRKWDPHGEVTSLPMYEHDTGPVDLLKQKAVGRLEHSIRQGWDERWSSSRP